MWGVCDVESVGIRGVYKGMATSSFLFPLPSPDRHPSAADMPYRSGGHTTAAAIEALGGESNYVESARRRRPPPVSRFTLSRLYHILAPAAICPPPHVPLHALHC